MLAEWWGDRFVRWDPFLQNHSGSLLWCWFIRRIVGTVRVFRREPTRIVAAAVTATVATVGMNAVVRNPVRVSTFITGPAFLGQSGTGFLGLFATKDSHAGFTRTLPVFQERRRQHSRTQKNKGERD